MNTSNPGFTAVFAVRSLLCDLTVPYWIIGGWAIDLAVGRVTREHADVDVMMLERDKEALRSDLTEVSVEPAGHHLRPGRLAASGVHRYPLVPPGPVQPQPVIRPG